MSPECFLTILTIQGTGYASPAQLRAVPEVIKDENMLFFSPVRRRKCTLTLLQRTSFLGAHWATPPGSLQGALLGPSCDSERALKGGLSKGSSARELIR